MLMRWLCEILISVFGICLIFWFAFHDENDDALLYMALSLSRMLSKFYCLSLSRSLHSLIQMMNWNAHSKCPGLRHARMYVMNCNAIIPLFLSFFFLSVDYYIIGINLLLHTSRIKSPWKNICTMLYRSWSTSQIPRVVHLSFVPAQLQTFTFS